MPKKAIDGISFSIETAGDFLIPGFIVNQLNGFQQNKPCNPEAGGILLGRQFENKPDIVIDEITTPITTDVRSRHSFYRSHGHHHFAVDKWKESGGYCLYIGLWHTHPEDIPSPSSIDYNDWKNAINNGEFEGDSLFFIIVGTEKICCWQGTRTQLYKRIIRRKFDFKQLRVAHE